MVMATPVAYLYVARSLRSQALPHYLATANGTRPPQATLWLHRPGSNAASDRDATQTLGDAYELAYLLTPTLYAAVQQQVDALRAAWDDGKLSTDKAQVAADRWGVVVEHAAEAGWLARGGCVASVTAAQVAADRLPEPYVPLWQLVSTDEAFALLPLDRGLRNDDSKLPDS
jgi:hypothetical protein